MPDLHEDRTFNNTTHPKQFEIKVLLMEMSDSFGYNLMT
jgi:hypothetical protein